MSEYKLTYFKNRGKAETTRMLFAVGGIAYEDARFPKDTWPEVKKTTPFGQVPMLEVDGVTLCQSRAMESLVAKRTGLHGKTELDEAKALMYVQCMDDMTAALRTMFRITDEEQLAEMKKKYLTEQLPVFMGYFENFMGKDGFFLGNQITWPDIALFVDLARIQVFVEAEVSFDKYPRLKQLMENVETNPKIKEWIEKRPVTRR